MYSCSVFNTPPFPLCTAPVANVGGALMVLLWGQRHVAMKSWAIGGLRQNQEVSPSIFLFRLCFAAGCCFFEWSSLLNYKLIGRIITDLCLFRQTAMTLQYLLEERLEIKNTVFQSRTFSKPTSFISEEDPYSSCFRISGQQGQRGREVSFFTWMCSSDVICRGNRVSSPSLYRSCATEGKMLGWATASPALRKGESAAIWHFLWLSF